MDSTGDYPRRPIAERPSSAPARSNPRWLRPALLTALVAPIGAILIWSAMESGHAGHGARSSLMLVSFAFVTLPLFGLAGAGIAVFAFRRGAHRHLAVASCAVSVALALPIVSIPLAGGLQAIQNSFIDTLAVEAGQEGDTPAQISPAAENHSSTHVVPVSILAEPIPPVAAEPATTESPVGEQIEGNDVHEVEGGAPVDEIADWADREQIGRIKRVDISTLDPGLSGRSFSEWLHDLAGPDGRVYWETNDCGEGGDGRESPTCVEAEVKWQPCGTLSMAFSVADLKGKTIGTPASWGGWLSGIGVGVKIKSLHEVPERLREARALDDQLRAYAEHHLTSDEVFAAAKRVEMRVLDDQMGRGSFGDWIENLAGPGRPVRWLATGCSGGLRELYLRDSCDDSWACAEAQFEDDHDHVTVSVRLGTFRRGLIGKPAVDQVSHWVSGPSKGGSKPKFSPSLHELSAALSSTKP